MGTHLDLTEGWKVWSLALIRSAGFPLEEALELEDLGPFVGNPRFREAVAWQNRRLLSEVLDRCHEGKGWRRRQRQKVVASYVQRYYAKNDTIGFFGPVGWGRFHSGPTSLVPGKELLRSRSCHFEPWAMTAWAEWVAQLPEVLPHLKPRLRPSFWLEEGALFGDPRARNLACRRQLSEADYELLLACDGSRTVASLKAGEDILRLRNLGYITLTPYTPVDAQPEETLLRFLEGIEDPVIRDVQLENLKRLVAAKEKVGAAAGDAQALGEALNELDQLFEETTGGEAYRNAGQTYGARTLVYEDCLRDFELKLDQELLQGTRAGLVGLMLACRWFSFRLAVHYLRLFERVYERLSGQLGEQVPMPSFTRELDAHGQSPIPEELTRELEEKWEELFGDEAHIEGGEFLARANSVFGAPGPGWPGARHHSPDLLFHAEGPGLSGESIPVLGEVHAGLNTWCTLWSYEQHPNPKELVELYEADLTSPGLSPVPWEPHARCAIDLWLTTRDYHLLEYADAVSWRPPEKQLRLGDLVVHRSEGELRVSCRGGGPSFHIIQFFERSFKLWTGTGFDILGHRKSCPRLTVDKLVVLRQRWHYPKRKLQFAQSKDPAKRLKGCRQFLERQQLPRFFFAKSPEEMKPIFVDRQSSQLLELFSKMARDTDSGVTLSEMLPGPEGLWLQDAEGRGYTSELRLVAVDPVEFDPSYLRSGSVACSADSP